mmetsp:Transcript_40716/g.116453  ORF Transcript_40716/g.116453 Transcript_40716/m.116453 type:complete len:212 (+) Transcript_40716:436-1071(+)
MVSRALLAHHTRDHGPRVEADAHGQAVVVADASQGPLERQRHLHRAHRQPVGSSVLDVLRLGAACTYEVGVPDDLHLVQLPIDDDLVKGGVHGVEKVHNFLRRYLGGQGGKTFDVREHHRDPGMVLRNRRDALGDEVHHVRGQEALEQRPRRGAGVGGLLQAQADTPLLEVGDVLQVFLEPDATRHTHEEDEQERKVPASLLGNFDALVTI